MAIAPKAFEIGWLDRLATRDTALARVDARAKLLVTLAFIVTVVSFPRYQVVALLPMAIFPAALMVMGRVPLAFIARKVLLGSTFAIMLGIFNPVLDRTPAHVFGFAIAGGWLSYASLLIRFALTVSAALAIIAGTGMPSVCRAMESLGAPQVFAVQVLMLYRYLFVLIEEGSRMARARDLRSFGNRGHGMRVYGMLLGTLLLRTLDRAHRVHVAMRCRGFDGTIHGLRPLRLSWVDLAFAAGWLGVFAWMRWLSPLAFMTERGHW